MGDAEKTKEESRDTRRVTWIQDLVQDLHYGLRTFRRSPGFTTVAVLTLALGIGANTAIFSIINAVLLQTLRVAHPHELVLFSDSPEAGTNSGTQTGRWILFSSDNYKYFRDHNESFKDLSAFQSTLNDLDIRFSGETGHADVAHGRLVSGNFFSLLGLSASLGRVFSERDDRSEASPTVMLSCTYWTRRFHNDPEILGKPIEINGTAYTIIGVAPPSFSDVKYDHPDIWLPLAFQSQVMSGNRYADDSQKYWLNLMGRLAPGMTLRQAQIVVNAQLQQILNTQAYRETPQEIANSYIALAPGAAGISFARITYQRGLQILAGIVAIVLLMACANVATLLLSRSSTRGQEIAVRLALGASRGRLIRQHLTESILLAALGGFFGILGAHWGIEILTAVVTGSNSAVKATIDSRTLIFTAGISVFSGVLFGLFPALRSTDTDLATPIKNSPNSRFRFGLGNGLVVFQIAASLVLVVGAGLFLRTLQKLADQALGFDEDHVVVARIDPWSGGYTPAQTPALYQSLIDRVDSISGVISATVEYSEPLSGSSWTSNFTIEDVAPNSARTMKVHKELVGPNYFATQGIPILLGRDIGPQDRPGSTLVTVINETMAREFFPGINPIGRRFSLGSPFNEKEAMTIVGVAADARFYSLRDPVPPMDFCAAFTVPDEASHNAAYAKALLLRVNGGARAISTEVRDALSQAAPNLPVVNVFVLSKRVSDSLRPNLSAAELSGAFGALALLLACLGVYATMAYRTSRRTREIGIRLALGADRSDVLWLILKECLALLAVAFLIGIPVALASSRLIANQLFDVRPADPLTFIIVSVLLTIVTLAASYVPARRAMRVDPMVALRYE
jgi:predicted permease